MFDMELIRNGTIIPRSNLSTKFYTQIEPNYRAIVILKQKREQHNTIVNIKAIKYQQWPILMLCQM